MQKQSQQLMLMLVIGILIGTMAVMVWKGGSQESGEAAVNTTPSGASNEPADLSTTTSESIAEAKGFPSIPEVPKNTRVGITVEDQDAGTTVAVSGLSLTEKHWIAIYDDSEGHPGWILGAARVHPGDTSATVELLRPAKSGGKYYAAILEDSGGEAFNRLTDLPPLSPDKVVVVSFMVR